MIPNNRSADRYSLYDSLQICYEGFTKEIPIRVPDLSTCGMFINTAMTFPEGAVLRISFVLPRTNVQIRARSEVRYCLSGVGLGVEFINLESEQVKSIERELSARTNPQEAGKDASTEAVPGT
jgi:PilZ domain